MTLIKSWAPLFTSTVRMRGRAYQLEGKVERQTTREGELARALVTDDQVYEVVVREDGDSASADCTCAHFARGQYCQHIWATLLDLQQAGDVELSVEDGVPRPPKARKRSGERRSSVKREPEWVGRLSLLRPPPAIATMLPGAPRQVVYVIHPEVSQRRRGLVVEVRVREATRTGWGRGRPLRLTAEAIDGLVDDEDRQICALLLGASGVEPDDYDRRYVSDRSHAMFLLPPGSRRPLLQRMLRTERCFIQHDGGEPTLLNWDGDEPWVVYLVGRGGQHYEFVVELRRGEQVMPIDEPTLTLPGAEGVVTYGSRIAPLDDRGASKWVTQFVDDVSYHGELRPIVVPAEDIQRFLDRLYLVPALPELDLPDGIARPVRTVIPEAKMQMFTPTAQGGADAARGQVTARYWFDYEGVRVEPGEPGQFVTTEDQQRVLLRRDLPFERSAAERLAQLGFRAAGEDTLQLPVRQSAEVAAQLLAAGWRLLADNVTLRRASSPRLSVASGIDWFELRGSVDYETEGGSQQVDIADILAAVKAGRHMIELGDGTQGLLPEQWLEAHGLLAAVGELHDDHLRFKASQAVLLDTMLNEQELVDVDAKFAEVRRRLDEFDGIREIAEPATFEGQLRPYQRQGLGWMAFQRWFGTGGILADDMGLGKTVQVLAMLDAHYDNDQPDTPAEEHLPTLIVAPRSVVFNWIDEAARFAPKLRVQAYTGADRHALRDAFVDHDVIITSYGLMRRDIAELREHRFEYVVLDEAQAIKNPASQSAKAARLIEARHRLALTGTPVENHLGDLWSIFEFLNPGILGSSTRFSDLVRTGVEDPTRATAPRNVETATQISRALSPFILRRTKSQVLKDLPEKTEQTIVCEMEPAQREFYDQLRKHYRSNLLTKLEGAPGTAGSGAGFGKSTMMVLEALLRLRQAACHPGLIDPRHEAQPSAKTDVLLERLADLIDEGHKALVYSQFTSMLAIVRKYLDERGVVYEYLDGQTRQRKKRVDRFQNDPDCPVFLISLKAGGLGLNLTAAEYVFILDPWWNPAVEAQAIDRTHRIGQTQHVFAYRLICADTVEQRIIELQNRKRKLADAIIGGQENLLRELTRDDLEALLA